MIEIKITYYPTVKSANRGVNGASISKRLFSDGNVPMAKLPIVMAAAAELFKTLLMNHEEMKKEYGHEQEN